MMKVTTFIRERQDNERMTFIREWHDYESNDIY